jgi:ribonuclease Z
MQLTVLGSGAGGPFQGRNYTAHLLKHHHETFLIDCGEGTQHQLYRYGLRHDNMKQIFITHLHGDHVFGLMGLITSFCLKKRTDPLTIYGPTGLAEWIATNSRLAGVHYPYEVQVVEVDTTSHAKIFESKLTEVWTIPLQHRTACSGWLFRAKPKHPNMRPEAILQYGIPYTAIPDIKAGGDYTLPDGQVIPHHELTTPPAPPISYAFCSDTLPNPTVAECVQGATLLYHEATFTNQHQAEAAYSGHSTAEQAAEIARTAQVGQLLIGHFSARYSDTAQHLLEARAIFPNTEAVEEGRTFLI